MFPHLRVAIRTMNPDYLYQRRESLGSETKDKISQLWKFYNLIDRMERILFGRLPMSRQKSWLLCLSLLFLLKGFVAAQEWTRMKFAGQEISPGETKFVFLPVSEEAGRRINIPVTVIRGKKEGPTLALVAGIHGYEYPPILALYRLKKKISPSDLAGTLIIVHIANLPSFQRRTIYYNPYDWKNLNRVFPGDPEGTLSERIAYVLTEEVVKKCDYLIDCHCGDGNEDLIPSYIYWMVTGDNSFDQRSKQLALAFGIKRIIIDRTRNKDLKHSKYLGNTAIILRKPAITIESGYLGRTDEKDITRVVKGVINVLRHLKMIKGKPAYVDRPLWIDRYQVIYSEDDGLFFPLKSRGDLVEKDEIIGYIMDYQGRKKVDLRAPFAGEVLYIIKTPPANRGEPLFEIGHHKQN